MAFLPEVVGLMVNNPIIYRGVLNLLARVEFKRDLCLKVRGLKMYSNTPDRLLATFLWKVSVLENFETQFLQKFVRPGMRVVDIGANIGYYTLFLSQLVGRDGSVTAFEPDPNNYRLLLKNIVFNRAKNITAFKKAVSNKNGHARLFLNKGHRGDHRIFNRSGRRPSLGIETTTIDTVLQGKKVDLIKMDIQGAEFLALRGMLETINNNPNITIITEFSPTLLEECGTSANHYIAEIEAAGLGFELINEKTRRLEPIEKEALLKRCHGNHYENLLLRR